MLQGYLDKLKCLHTALLVRRKWLKSVLLLIIICWWKLFDKILIFCFFLYIECLTTIQSHNLDTHSSNKNVIKISLKDLNK